MVKATQKQKDYIETLASRLDLGYRAQTALTKRLRHITKGDASELIDEYLERLEKEEAKTTRGDLQEAVRSFLLEGRITEKTRAHELVYELDLGRKTSTAIKNLDTIAVAAANLVNLMGEKNASRTIEALFTVS